jgi:hypothetical protein
MDRKLNIRIRYGYATTARKRRNEPQTLKGIFPEKILKVTGERPILMY